MIRLPGFLATAMALCSTAAWAQAVPPIAPGTYLCKAGGSRMMLTLGEITISGSKFTFKAPTGPVTSGTWAIASTGYKWTGALGSIRAEQIVESGKGSTANDFWFTFRSEPGALPTSTSCGR